MRGGGSGGGGRCRDRVPEGASDSIPYPHTVHVEYGWILPAFDAYVLEFQAEIAEDLPNFVNDPDMDFGQINSPEAGNIAQVTGPAIGSYARVRVKLSNGSLDPSSIAAVSVRVDARLDHE